MLYYSNEGNIIRSEMFKNGLKDGKEVIYSGDTSYVREFKSGKEIVKEIKPAKTKPEKTKNKRNVKPEAADGMQKGNDCVIL